MNGIGMQHYVGVADGELIAEIRRLARSLYGLRVLHVNATFHGGGVASMLYSLIPLMNDVGLDADWSVLYGDPALFAVTKQLHNGLQGEPVDLTEADLAPYLATNEAFARYSPILHDVVIAHDPQPLPLIRYAHRENPWVWRCHIDVSSPDAGVERLLSPYILQYDAAVVSSEAFRRPGWPLETAIAAPAIDPFSDLNRDLSDAEIDAKLAEYGIDKERPLLLQVSRFDKWKDPLGVLHVFENVQAETPCQLVMLGNMASDDPEGPVIFGRVKEAAAKLDGARLITDNDPLLVNALQRQAAVVLQMSLREGFGLTVSEAMWKKTPVVATRVGGIPLQVVDGETGFLVEAQDYDAATDRALRLLRDTDLAASLAANAREHVRKQFLIPRLLRDWLQVFVDVTG